MLDLLFKSEILQNINCCVIIVLGFELLHFPFFLFSNLCSGIVGSGVLQPVDMLGFEVSGTHLENGMFLQCCGM